MYWFWIWLFFQAPWGILLLYLFELFLILKLYILLLLCAHVCIWVYMSACVWRSEDNLQKLILPFHHMGLGHWAQVGGRCFYLLIHLTHPLWFFNVSTHNYKLPFKTALSISRVSFHLHLTPVPFDFPPDFFFDSFITKECIV